MPLKLQVRRDTASQWTLNNPELLPGELGFEIDTRRIKIGSVVGQTWNEIDYINSPLNSHSHNIQDINLWEENVQAEILNFISESETIVPFYNEQQDQLTFKLKSEISSICSINAPWSFKTIFYQKFQVPTTSGEVVLDILNANIFILTPLDNINIGTSTIISDHILNIMIIINNTANVNITFEPGKFYWMNGELPSLSSGIHILSFISFDSSSTWHNIGSVFNSQLGN